MSTPVPQPLEPWFVAGPPFGPVLFAGVRDHLGAGVLVDVLDLGASGGGWRERGEALAAQAEGRLVVAHGLAVPAALHAAAVGGPAAVLVSNGPVTRVDPVTSALARLLALPGAAQAVLQPSVWLAWLRSSAGLRRAVANPYVMDRDTVATLCESRVADAGARSATAAYLRSLRAGLPDVAAIRVPTWLAWGDEDILYPNSEADFLDAALGGGRRLVVPGGRWAHPVERPWAVADGVETVARMAGSSARSATVMSRSGHDVPAGRGRWPK